mmetsp:Transcript_9676/g.20801  ORF Transcript_9676/g.20801 Transcript_9676/m.20801 type:complete len:206 (-) Transcript_9676:6-623(-)
MVAAWRSHLGFLHAVLDLKLWTQTTGRLGFSGSGNISNSNNGEETDPCTRYRSHAPSNADAGAITKRFEQVGILWDLARNGYRMTAYLPSLANLTYEFPKFLKSACPDLVPSSLLREPMSSGDPFGYYKAAKAVWGEQGGTARALCAIHAMDYACWEDLPEGVPLLCQDVFSGDGFSDIFLAQAENRRRSDRIIALLVPRYHVTL